MASIDNPASRSFAGDTRQLLTFRLGEEEYAVDILRVQEIKGFTAITPIPNVPAYIKGVMNLRGTVVPIWGLRDRLGLASATYDRFSVVIVVAVAGKSVGMVVDAVTDVINVADAQIEPPPDFGVSVDTSVLHGMAKLGDKLVLLLDIDRVLVDADVALRSAEGEAAAIAG